jgi:hypothetical protein
MPVWPPGMGCWLKTSLITWCGCSRRSTVANSPSLAEPGLAEPSSATHGFAKFWDTCRGISD